jgi:hypothetical protein
MNGQNPPPPRPWLKPSHPSSSHMTSRPSCYSSSWPTFLMVEMGLEMPLLQLRSPTETSQLLIHRSSPRQENLLRLIIGFSGDRDQIWPPTLHESSEDSLRHAAAAWRHQRMVGQLHRRSPRGLSSAMGQVLQHIPHPSHSSRRDEEKLPRVYGPKVR